MRDAALRAERRAAFLAEAGEVLSSSLDYEETPSSVADLAVPYFADWATFDLLSPDGTLRRVAVRHTDANLVPIAYEVSEKYPQKPIDPELVAIRTGESFLIEEIPEKLIDERAVDQELVGHSEDPQNRIFALYPPLTERKQSKAYWLSL